MMGARYVDEHERALVAHYREAGEERRLSGEAWYRESRHHARRIARATGVTLSQAAGVIAALSPRMRWGANVALAEELCAGREVRGVFGNNLRKAERILDGERPLDVLGGDKVRAFYRAIMGDGEAVVLDVWMMRAAGWVKPTLTSTEYQALASSLTAAARRVGLNPADFQAIVWTHVRGSGE
jgi:hypothetical protein